MFGDFILNIDMQDPNIAICDIEDERLTMISECYNNISIIHQQYTLIDTGGVLPGASAVGKLF